MKIDSLDIVKDMITAAESCTVEFKETTGQLERGMETLCAFLNNRGGTVFFGVNDKGKIVGQDVSDKTKRDIAEAINRIEPITAVQISYIPLPQSEKKVIAFHVEESKFNRPFCYKGRAYMRVESATSTMPQETYNQLLMQRGGNYGWEAMTNPELQIEDLDEKAIMGAVRSGIRGGRLPETTITEDIPTILEKLDLLHNGKLNNAAAVLFGRNFYSYPQCLLRMARFKGTTKEEFWDNQRVQGNVFELLDAAMGFFFKHLSLSGKIEGIYREEELSVPYKALRECCINAYAHRSYHHPGSSVSIAIYDNRIEVTNSGTLPPDMSIERLLNTHDSRPHNPIIANVLYKSTVLESWGRGIKLIIDECRRVGIPEPEFHADGGFIWVVFHYTRVVAGREHPSTTQAPPKYHPSTTQVDSLIAIIGEGTYSVTEMMKKLQLNNRRYFTKEYLKAALTEKLIEPLYPESPKHPRQKYRLTEKGKEWLQQ
ncbi:MAG: putative DNA binding domain-containing protein [Paraprevotella sp.]|nr:putative DNA binding domain-containing protein [Paraprevotella sp.]